MLEAIMFTLKTMGWLGIVLMILVLVNTMCGTLYNVTTGKEEFSIRRLLDGLGKSFIFYISATFLSVALTMLPFINKMIEDTFEVTLLTEDLLNALSGVGVLTIVVAAIVVQGKKAIQGVTKLGNISADTEAITWEVEIPEENENEEE